MSRQSDSQDGGVRKSRTSGSISLMRGSNDAAAFDKMHKTGPGIKYMNSYWLHSKSPFHSEPVFRIIRDTMNEQLAEVVYDGPACSRLAITMSADIRSKVKALGFERYKLVCIVQIAEKNKQSVLSQCKFLWDSERDSYAVYSYENNSMLAAGLVFGLYYE